MKSSSRARTWVVACACATTLGLASCGSDDDTTTVEPAANEEASSENAEPAPTTAEDTAVETEEATESEDSAAETEGEDSPPGEATAPGTELKFGDPATVEFTYADEPGLINVTVTSIEKGEEADLEPLDLGDQASGLTPYYINIEIEGADASSEALTYASVDGAFDGLLADGSGAQSLSIIGDFEPCDSTDLGEFGEGTTVTTCVPYLASGDAAVESATYRAYDSPYDSLDGEPIVWSE